ncbi:hypothetical protein EV643_1452 [Kribbella sp. VKM Ac-2527]|uniref:Uncharacterized protein n=1 Tax=Kribbella caucasensis TaxID=2512215 RepID=A0A4V3C5E8_9ACTN|nr:hypothetical protein EV643_1452 [Kribbella sp. VKM Ac-2527]
MTARRLHMAEVTQGSLARAPEFMVRVDDAAGCNGADPRLCSGMADEAGSRLVELAGDRVVEVWEGGDAAGVPVVFHPGTPSGRLQARLG